jgi:IrrE N-terminal-like domain
LAQGPSKEWFQLPAEQRQIISAHFAAPPVPIGKIASDLGLVIRVSSLHPGISGEIRPDPMGSKSGFVIRVNRDEAKTRQRFTIAHEIAHFLLHRHLIKDGLSDDVLYRSSLSNRLEAEANRLAADLLMPWSLVNKWMEQFPGKSIDAYSDPLADFLQVSKVAMEVRLGNNG